MPKIQKAEIVDGVVANIAVFDADAVPDWATDWPVATEGAEIGGTYDGSSFLPAPLPAVTAEAARRQRQIELNNSDWTQVPDSPLSADSKAAWATYRQALRDITSQAGFPQDIIWPTPPE